MIGIDKTLQFNFFKSFGFFFSLPQQLSFVRFLYVFLKLVVLFEV